MLKIKIISVGKVKEKFFQAGINEYLKRMQSFCNCQIIIVKEAKFIGTPNEKQIKKIIEIEAQEIKEQIRPGEYTIATMLKGKELDSLEFAKKISELQIKTSVINFVIGGSYGLPTDFPKDLALSFGKMTYPHQLFRLILCEQIYRALMINGNRQYHK